MRSISKYLLGATLISVSLSGFAKDTKSMRSIQEAMSTPAAQEKLNKSIKFYFGKNAGYGKEIGTYVSNRKTNAVNKSDKEACEWVFLSALLSLQDRAIKEGGNAVINIHSYYKKNENYSHTEYECRNGRIMAGVALRGTVVKQ